MYIIYTAVDQTRIPANIPIMKRTVFVEMCHYICSWNAFMTYTRYMMGTL